MTLKGQNELLMRDEDFVTRFENAASPEEIVALYKEKGIEITRENAQASYDYVHRTGDELYDADLENVIGGVKVDFARFAAIATASAIAAGVVTAGTAAAISTAAALAGSPGQVPRA